MKRRKRKHDYPEDGYIFVKSFRHWRSGKVLHASDYGREAFRIPVN